MSRPLGSRPLQMTRPTLRCQCGKVYCLDLADAKRVRRLVARERGGDNQVRYYECRWGGWHWTQLVDPRRP